MTEVIRFPKESLWCCSCGRQMTERLCFFTCTVNGHLGTMVYCLDCLEHVKSSCGEGERDDRG